MAIDLLKCPSCGAGLQVGVTSGTLSCVYCDATLVRVGAQWALKNTDSPERAAADASARRDAGRPRVRVGGVGFVLLGRIAQGDGSDVFLGRRDERATEMVVIKVLRSLADADLLAREWTAVAAMEKSETQGSEFFAQMLPRPVVNGPLLVQGRDDPPRPASVFRWRSGFIHTLDDVVAKHPDGVDPRTAVWMWKRTLEMLGWVHRGHWTHGAVLPQHLLVHPRDHGIALVGWGTSSRLDRRERMVAVSAGALEYYPEAQRGGAAATRSSDITMSARCVLRALGGDPSHFEAPASAPGPLADLLRAYSDGTTSRRTDDAWELMERVGAAGKQAYGPTKYHPFSMPGWGAKA